MVQECFLMPSFTLPSAVLCCSHHAISSRHFSLLPLLGEFRKGSGEGCMKSHIKQLPVHTSFHAAQQYIRICVTISSSNCHLLDKVSQPASIFWTQNLLLAAKAVDKKTKACSCLFFFPFKSRVSFIWEWISVFHWFFKRFADSYTLTCLTPTSTHKSSIVLRMWFVVHEETLHSFYLSERD